jgi:hypothetical protein
MLDPELPEDEAALLLHAEAARHVETRMAPKATNGLSLVFTLILSP